MLSVSLLPRDELFRELQEEEPGALLTRLQRIAPFSPCHKPAVFLQP